MMPLITMTAEPWKLLLAHNDLGAVHVSIDLLKYLSGCWNQGRLPIMRGVRGHRSLLLEPLGHPG
jgi:hypothetical protein